MEHSKKPLISKSWLVEMVNYNLATNICDFFFCAYKPASAPAQGHSREKAPESLSYSPDWSVTCLCGDLINPHGT